MKSPFTLRGRKGQLLFLLSLGILCHWFGFPAKLSDPPHGLHFMRQTDCLSFVANYYHNGFDFFSPQLFTLHNEQGKAVCEFPILYYMTALLCLISYKPVFILKLLTFMIVCTGCFYLYKLLENLFQNVFYARVFTLLFISSTVLLYYSVNVLPDPAALGFTWIGWYHVFNFRNRRFACVWGFGFFTLASLLKVTFFMYPLAAVFYLGFMYREKRQCNWQLMAGCFCGALAAVLLWNLYVISYNTANHADSFLLQVLPVWSLSRAEIRTVTDHVFNYWNAEYYYQTTQHVFAAIVLLGIVFIRQLEKALLFLGFVLLTGCIFFIVLFFPQFKDHDYYFITILPGIVFIVAFAFKTLLQEIPFILESWILKGLMLIIALLSLNYGRKKLQERESRPPDLHAAVAGKLNNADKILDALHVPFDTKVIVYPDFSANGGLYLLNRPGWCIKDQKMFDSMRNKAQFIVLLDADSTIQIPRFEHVCSRKHFSVFRNSIQFSGAWKASSGSACGKSRFSLSGNDF